MRLMNWLRERLGAGQMALRGHRERRAARCPAARFQPRLEALEDRCVPSTLTVTNNSGDATVQGSLPYEVAQAQSGDTILITPTAEQNGPIVLNRSIYLGKNLTVEGQPDNLATISGGGTTPVFAVGNATVTLNDLNITDGRSSVGGGIFNGGTLTLNNCNVDDNTAYTGGGIYNSYFSSLTLNNCNVDHNTALGRFGEGGGGIENFGFRSTLTVINSTVSDNQAYLGGGIYNDVLYGKATVINSTLSGNQAFDGGGITNYFGNTLTVSNSTLSHNQAQNFAGGIWDAGTLTFSNSTLSHNQAKFSGGGIVMSPFDTATVTDSTLTHNTAGTDGGGIATYYGSSLTVGNSTLTHNTAGIDGGGISIEGVNRYATIPAILNLTGSTLTGNTASNEGGAIFSSVGSGTVSACNIINNSAVSGGGIYMFTGTLTLTGNTYRHNSPDYVYSA